MEYSKETGKITTTPDEKIKVYKRLLGYLSDGAINESDFNLVLDTIGLNRVGNKWVDREGISYTFND
jgi:hypothetical protein